MHGPPQPGWYPDPWAESWYRWWDGRDWTPSLHPAQVVVTEPRPPHVTKSFSPIAAIAILAITFGAIVFTSWVVDNIGIDEDWIVILIAYTVLFGLMTLGAWVLTAATAWAQAPVVEHYDLDAVGSVRAITDASRQAVVFDYAPFGDGGVGGGPSPAALRFAGKERDPETGLDY